MGREEELDPQEVRPALRLLHRLDKVRPGLGFALLWLTITRIGAHIGGGRGAFVVGIKGIGKAATIYGSRARPLMGAEVEAPGELHPRWLAEYLKMVRDDGGDPSRLSLTLEDLAPISDDRPKMKRVLNAGAWGVSDLKFADKGWHGRSVSGAADRFKSFHTACGMTPKVFGKITRLGPWGDMWSDRYSVFAPIITGADARRITPAMRTIPHDSVAQIIEGFLPPDLQAPEDQADPALVRECSRLYYDDQHTRARADVFLAQDLRGVAALCDSPDITDSHVILLMQAAPFLQLGSMPWEVIEMVQHGAQGDEPPTGRPVYMPQVVKDTGRRAGRLGPALSEAKRYGLLTWSSPTGKTGSAQIWAGVKLRGQLNNISRLSRWGARFGA